MRRLLAFVALAVISTPLAAQKNGVLSGEGAGPAGVHRFAWLLDGTFEFGGDELLEITFTDGSKQTIYAGQGGTGNVGVEFRGQRLGLRATVGFKFTSTAADNANIMFTRVPLRATVNYYPNPDWRVAAGPVMHTAVEFDGDGFTPNVTFDNAVGFTAEVGWRWLSATYTSLSYSVDGGSSINASAIGVGFTGVFGKRY